jgi:hypothetical protein
MKRSRYLKIRAKDNTDKLIHSFPYLRKSQWRQKQAKNMETIKNNQFLQRFYG